MIKKLFLLFILNLYFICGLTAADKLDLALNLKVGDIYKINIPMQLPTSIDISMSKESILQLLGKLDTVPIKDSTIFSDSTTIAQYAQQLVLDMKINLILMAKVLEKGKDYYQFELYYDDIYYYSKQKNEEIIFSPKSKTNKIPENYKEEYDNLKKIIGKKFLVTTTFAGKVREIKNYENIESLLSKDIVDKGVHNNSGLADQLQLKSIQNTLSDIFNILPDKSVKIGDSWIKELIVKDEVAPFIIKTKYTLKNIQNDSLLISGTTIIYSNNSAPNQFITDGMGNAVIYLSRKDLFSQEQTNLMDLKMKMSFIGLDMVLKSDIICAYTVKKIN